MVCYWVMKLWMVVLSCVIEVGVWVVELWGVIEFVGGVFFGFVVVLKIVIVFVFVFEFFWFCIVVWW